MISTCYIIYKALLKTTMLFDGMSDLNKMTKFLIELFILFNPKDSFLKNHHKLYALC